MDVLNKLSKRERVIFYIVTALIVIALIYNFLAEPLFKKWALQAREISLAKVKLQRHISIIKQKDKIDKEYNLYADKLKPKASDEQELTSVLNEIEKFARSANVKISDMRPKPPKDELYYKRFAVDVETESDMSALMKFIYDVKNSPQLLKVERININTKSSPAGTIIQASMIISKVSIK